MDTEWYRNSQTGRPSAHARSGIVTSMVEEPSRFRTKPELARRPQTANRHPAEARETLLRRAVRYQRGEPFVVVRALRSSAQLRPEEKERNEGGRKKRKEGRKIERDR